VERTLVQYSENLQSTLRQDSVLDQLPTFRTSGLLPRETRADFRPYLRSTPVPKTDTGVHDAAGVRMVVIDGQSYDQPLDQAAYGLDNLVSYSLTGDRLYLDRAVAQASRLTERRVESRGGWYYPYPFDFDLHGYSGERMSAPWYSGMAQGQALSLFSRLHTATGEARWRSAAEATFVSLLNPPSETAPWVTRVDASGLLWLEEYPRNPPERSDRTFNGQMYALFGLHDWWVVSRDPRVEVLFDGAATMVRSVVGSIRDPGWISRYCQAHPEVRSPKYHDIHEVQLRFVHAMTRQASFASSADLYMADYPSPAVSGTVTFNAGIHRGYRFDSAGRVLASRDLHLVRSSTAPADRRSRILQRGIYYRVTAGSLSGYWVAEQYGARVLRGSYAPSRYGVNRTIRFAAGTYSAYQFGTDGAVTSHRTATLVASSSAAFDRSAWWNGRRHVRVVNGIWASMWMPLSSATTLA
jgi:hypothetical protein